MTLRDAAVGSTVVVSKITGDPAYKRRIMDMGRLQCSMLLQAQTSTLVTGQVLL